jgi:hypothetical protein
MTFGNVYNTIRNAALSTVICLDFVDKDCWNERKTGRAWPIGSPRVGWSA